MLENLINKLLNHYKNILGNEKKEILLISIKKILKDYSHIENPEMINPDDFQFLTSNLEEKTNKRKKMGVYYTPVDLCAFMIKKMIDNDEEISEKTVFEPTCGNSEFLLSYFDYVYNKNFLKSDIKLINFIEKIYGNDINLDAIVISKLRLLFKVFEKLENKNLILEVADILNKNFSNLDAIDELHILNQRYDYIVGNPPYVETSKYPKNIEENFGNIYANILKNSLLMLKENGKLCFVIPISYVSTIRMKKIRDFVFETTKKQIVYNFSDRPDSLFSSVHQKLTILIAEKSDYMTEEHKVYSSSYTYWYKSERENMFNSLEVTEVEKMDSFIPKLGNEIEKNIFKKVFSIKKNDILYDRLLAETGDSLYLNMRCTFWMKCFMNGAKSKEYKEFKLNSDLEYIYCLLNSSLFFWYWTVISDCWHITNKEFKSFRFLTTNNKKLAVLLAEKLEKKLEKTKKFIGSKQVEYEYKHKECKDIIDEIDEFIGKIYSLTSEEIKYIKSFNERYRMSKGEENV